MTICASDPAFADMDFPTRNLYRSAIEELARGSGLTEIDVAGRVLKAASDAADSGGEGRTRDPGYYLIAGGRPAFEAGIGFRPPLRRRLGRLSIQHGDQGLCRRHRRRHGGPAPVRSLDGVGTCGRRLVSGAFRHRRPVSGDGCRNGADQPRGSTDLRGDGTAGPGTRPRHPAASSHAGSGSHAADQSEGSGWSRSSGWRSIISPAPAANSAIALLTDWLDADEEKVAGDDELLTAATEAIARLNAAYGRRTGQGTRATASSSCIAAASSMRARTGGWDGSASAASCTNSTACCAAPPTRPSSAATVRRPPCRTDVRYVITLDADTRLPRDTVRRLIGKMAHPLNRPRFDHERAAGRRRLRASCSRASRRRCRSGARVALPARSSPVPAASTLTPPPSPTSTRTCSARVPIPARASTTSTPSRRRCTGAFRTTPCSATISSRAFSRAPALASDIEVVEEFPARYDVAAKRQHRWARGDWQLLPWIIGKAGGPSSRPARRCRRRALEDARQSAALAAGAG